MPSAWSALLCVWSCAQQEPAGQWEESIRRAIREVGTKWTAAEGRAAEQRLLAAMQPHASNEKGRLAEALNALRTLLDQGQPISRPLFDGELAHLNSEAPLPPQVREREFEAGLQLIESRLTMAFSRPRPDVDQRASIRAQLEELHSRAEPIVMSRVTDPETREETAYWLRLARGSEMKLIGESFHLGFDRTLTKEEFARTLHMVEEEADRLKGLVLGTLPEGEGEEQQRAFAEWQKRQGLIMEVAGAAGRARTLIYPPEVFAAMQRHEDARDAYRLWAVNAADSFNRAQYGRAAASIKLREEEARARCHSTDLSTTGLSTELVEDDVPTRTRRSQPSATRAPSVVVALLVLTATLLILVAFLRKR